MFATRINEESKPSDEENVVYWDLKFGSQEHGVFIFFIVTIQSQQFTLYVSVSIQSVQNRVSMRESD